MKKRYLFLMIILSTCLFSKGYGQYDFTWSPPSLKLYGDPVNINTQSEFLVIGSSLEEDLFDLSTAEFSINGGAWRKASAVYNTGYERYDFELPGCEIIPTSDTTLVTFRILENGSGDFITSEAMYFYTKPKFAVTQAQGQSNPSDIFFVDHQEAFDLHVRAWINEFPGSSYGSGDKNLSALHLSLNPDFSDYISIDDDPPATTLDFELSDLFDYFPFGSDGIYYGLNTLYLRIEGAGDVENEYSNVQKIEFFVFDFSYDQEEYCKYDSLYQLTGFPFGGVFTGDCVVSGTNLFNPSLAGNITSTSVTYTYSIGDISQSVTKDIPLLGLPLFTVGGPVQVCGFEHGSLYNVESNQEVSSLWQVNDASLNSRPLDDGNTLFVDWSDEGTGHIHVTVSNTDGCVAKAHKIIEIGELNAPADSADVILNDRMLICSDTTVNFYYWYRALADEDVFLSRTENNYYALGFQPVETDSFYVLTAYDTLGCVTHSRYSAEEDKLKDGVYLNQRALSVSPNPASNQINIYIPATDEQAMTLVVSSLRGEVLLREAVSSSLSGYYHFLDVSSLRNGIYLITLQGRDFSKFSKVIITKK